MDSNIDSLVFAQDGDLDDVAGFQAFDGFAEVSDGANVLAIDGDDQVGCASVKAFENERSSTLAEQGGTSDAGLLGGTAGSQAFDQQAFLRFENPLDPDLGSVNAAVGDEFRDDS